MRLVEGQPYPRLPFLHQKANVNFLANMHRLRVPLSSSALLSLCMPYSKLHLLCFDTHSRTLCEIRTQNRILCVSQLINKIFPNCIPFGVNDLKFLVIVIQRFCTCTDPFVPPTKIINLISLHSHLPRLLLLFGDFG